jgi:putative transposase
MIERDHPQLSIRRQAALLEVNRNRLEPKRGRVSAADERIMHELDAIHTDLPFFGQRRLRRELRDRTGERVGRSRMRRLMCIMGMEAVGPKPKTSKPAPQNKVYPYLLRNRVVHEPDEVWCADITYVPMPKGFAYLVAIMDWKSRAVLAWELSNTLDAAFCVRALRKAVDVADRAPGIMNTDQGCQFTGGEWIGALEEHGVAVSMDGRGRWMDNVFIERLWRSLKYEEVYLWSHGTLPELEAGISRWMDFYNHRRRHQGLDEHTPWEVYREPQRAAA